MFFPFIFFLTRLQRATRNIESTPLGAVPSVSRLCLCFMSNIRRRPSSTEHHKNGVNKLSSRDITLNSL